MHLRPILDRVLIETIPAPEMHGRIIIPDSARTAPAEGIVRAVGPGKFLDDGTRCPPELSVGDRVYFDRYAADPLEVDWLPCHRDSKLMTVRSVDFVFARLTDGPKAPDGRTPILLHAVGSWVLVRRTKPADAIRDEKGKVLVWIPDEYQKHTAEGVALSVGPGRVRESDGRRSKEVKFLASGDYVHFGAYNQAEYRELPDILFVHADEVYAIGKDERPQARRDIATAART